MAGFSVIGGAIGNIDRVDGRYPALRLVAVWCTRMEAVRCPSRRRGTHPRQRCCGLAPGRRTRPDIAAPAPPSRRRERDQGRLLQDKPHCTHTHTPRARRSYVELASNVNHKERRGLMGGGSGRGGRSPPIPCYRAVGTRRAAVNQKREHAGQAAIVVGLRNERLQHDGRVDAASRAGRKDCRVGPKHRIELDRVEKLDVGCVEQLGQGMEHAWALPRTAIVVSYRWDQRKYESLGYRQPALHRARQSGIL